MRLPRLELQQMDEPLVDAHVTLSRAHFGDAFPSERGHIAWKHLDNPQGRSAAHHLWDGTDLIGRIVYQRRDFHCAGRILRAGYLTDLLIHPAHRGVATFLRLMREVRRVAGLDFLYVTPNATSGPLFRAMLRFRRHHLLSVMACPVRSGTILARLLGWRQTRLAGPVDRLLGVGLGLGRIVARRPFGLALTTERPSDGELDALDRALAASGDLVGRRAARFHDWRFRDGPVFRTRVLYCRDEGRLIGYVALRDQEYLGYDTRFVIDACFAPDARPRVLRHVRWHVVADARRDGRDLLLGIFMQESPRNAVFCSLPFLRVPERYLPQGVDLWIEPLTPDLALPDDPARCPLTLADLDVF